MEDTPNPRSTIVAVRVNVDAQEAWRRESRMEESSAAAAALGAAAPLPSILVVAIDVHRITPVSYQFRFFKLLALVLG